MAEPLFAIEDLTQEPSTGKPLTAHAENGQVFSVMGRKVDVLAFLPKLERKTQLHFCTEGKWSSNELLAKLLEVTGPAEVALTSYSFTENPLRMLQQYMSSGIITDLFILTDKRVERENPRAYQLAKANFANLKLVNIHAKLMVIRNAHWNLTVVSSANFTRNKRIEAGSITEDEHIAAFHFSWIQVIISDEAR